MLSPENTIYILNSKRKATENTIGIILRDLFYNHDEFLYHNISDISDKYSICNKSLKNYLKSIFYKKKGNEKTLQYSKEMYELIKDLENINNKFKGFITNKEIELAKFYLNNMKI